MSITSSTFCLDWLSTYNLKASLPTMTTTDVLGFRRDGAVAHLVLDRPEALNSFDEALQRELRDAVDQVAADASVRAVVLTGSGRAFSAGADLSLDDLGPSVRLGPRTEEELRMRYNPIIRALRDMPKPVVAAVNGPAVGVGVALALACDQVLAAQSATFTLAFAKVGLTLDAGASLLLGARVGMGRASRMALLGERVDAPTALAWGMVDEVVGDEEVAERAATLATELAAGPTAAYAAIKADLNAALLPGLDAVLHGQAAAQSALVDSADFREGAAAFAQRRRPEFLGR